MIWLTVVCIIDLIGANWLNDDPYHDIKIRLYASIESYTAWSLEDAMDLFSTAAYNSTLDTVMIILEHDEDQDGMIQQTVQALFGRKLNETFNILAVVLPEQFAFSARNLYYLRPVNNVPSTGETLGDFINAAKDENFITPEKVSVISFGLGAQIAGYMGRQVNGLLHSIIGVDPAGLGFDWASPVTRLTHVSGRDASSVHLYHSNSAVIGSTRRSATADYLFNSGETQDGCDSLFDPTCSHDLGFLYFLEALEEDPGLPAVQCNSLDHLMRCKCDGNRLSYVGFPPDTSATGQFVLRTSEDVPYSLGKEGVRGTLCKGEKSDYSNKMGLYYDKVMHLLE